MKILTNATGTVKTERGNEECKQSFIRDHKLTADGCERINHRDNPGSKWICTSVEHFVYDRL